MRCNHRREYAALKYCACVQRSLISDLAVARLPSGNWSAKELKCVNGCWQTWVLLAFCQVTALFNVNSLFEERYGILNPNKAIDCNA